MTMTTKYSTRYLNSLSILELRKLKVKILLTLVNRPVENNHEFDELFKKTITELSELAKTVDLGVRFLR
jgi:hypothetical protein